jgi:DNA-binding NarL/FixJ family response regulator
MDAQTRRGTHRIGFARPNKLGNASTLVFCDNVAVAQAVSRGLGMERARAARLPAHFAAPWNKMRSGHPPALAIVIPSGTVAITTACRILKRRWPQVKVVVAGVQNHEDAILDTYGAGADGIVLTEESLGRLCKVARDTLTNRFSPPQNPSAGVRPAGSAPTSERSCWAAAAGGAPFRP